MRDGDKGHPAQMLVLLELSLGWMIKSHVVVNPTFHMVQE